MTTNAWPALHNAMWPGLVGKGPDSEPPIDLETMLNLTAAASVDGVRFDGVDLFLSLPHTDIDSSDDDLARLADSIAAKGLRAGSLVAPVWPPTGGGSAMGDAGRAVALPDAGAESLPHRKQAPRSEDPPVRDRAHRFRRQRRRLGQRSRREHQADRRDLPRGLLDRRRSRRTAGRRGRDLLGRHAWLAAQRGVAGDGGPPEDPRVPGGHGAHHAVHHGL